jgi:hypothetical protein
MGEGNLAANNKMIAEAIIQLLYNLPALVAIVGNRISPNVVTVGEPTPAVYVLDTNMNEMECDNSNQSYYGTVEIGVLSEDYNKCNTGIRTIRDYLKNYSGAVVLLSGEGTVGMSVAGFQSEEDGYIEEDRMNLKVMTFEIYAKIKS